MSLDLVAAVMCITLGALLACYGITDWLGTPLDPDPATWANNAETYHLGAPDGPMRFFVGDVCEMVAAAQREDGTPA